LCVVHCHGHPLLAVGRAGDADGDGVLDLLGHIAMADLDHQRFALADLLGLQVAARLVALH
jgi:hypothetical protein